MAITRDAKVIDDLFRQAGVSLTHSPLRGFFDPASVLILARILRDVPRDRTYVHVHRYRDAFTVLLAKRLVKRPDVRVISTRHKVRPGRNSWLFRRIYDKINAHIFVSKAAFDSFRSTWRRQLPMSLHTVHILLDSIKLPEMELQPEPTKGPIFAIYPGPLAKGKGPETIIDALTALKGKKIRLRIVGNGNPDYIDTLRRRAMVRNVMEMIDWKVTRDIPMELIMQSHFVVLPSVEREGFGLPNIRAMASARPQICTPNGAQAEYLTDGETAIFVPPADAYTLAEEMLRMATDAELRHTMGQKAYEYYAANMSWEWFVPKLTEIYLKA